MILVPGTQLGPYEIVSQLGQGGMGVVYQATDPRLKRTVGIKLLPPDLTREETAKQRFLHEAQAASALDHPNICTIYEINETPDGQLYLVMAHYEGETLKERIGRGPLALDDALDIATQVGRGLAEAHGAGIVHRDIKPANLFVTKNGVVKILDFGLAKLTGTEGVTQTGTTVGTVAYMSPEQARGQEVDHRTDIWSLGVVLYEMLAGKAPFQGENLLSLAESIRSREPVPLTGGSSSLGGVVTRALGKDASDRYQSVTELLADLRTAPDSPVLASEPELPSMAVLPFADLSREKDQDYFCDGLAEELIDTLARVKGLRVVSRASAFRFRGDAPDLRDVGRQLNVRTLLSGSVRKAGERLRINLQLVNTDDGCHLWSERFDRQLDDIFAVQEEIARTVADRMNVASATSVREPVVPPTLSVKAHDAYLRGHFLLTQQLRRKEAVEYFERALALDPGYARAHTALAEAYGYLGGAGDVDPAEAAGLTRAAALHALRLDPGLAEAHVTLGWTHMNYDWDWGRAEKHFQTALQLDPDSADAHSRYGCYLSWVCGRMDDALVHATRAVELDPMSYMPHHWKSGILILARRPADGMVSLERAAAIDQASWYLHNFFNMANRQLGRYDVAVDEGRTAVTLSGRHPWAVADLGISLAERGDRHEARSLVDELVARSELEHAAPVHIAALWGALDETDNAFQFLERAYDTHDAWCVHFKRVPHLDSLRKDPRFDQLLGRMNFPQEL